MATEVSLRERLDGLAESSRYDSAEFYAPPAAPIETPASANARVSLRVHAHHADDDDPPQLSQHTDLSGSERSFGSGRKLIAGIAVVLALGLPALAYFFLASPSEKAITQTAELAPGVTAPPATPAEAAPAAAPAAAVPSATPAAAAWPDSPPVMNSARPPEPVQASPKVAQSRDVLYLQRPGVNIRSTPSPTGSALGTAPKGTRFKVTNRQGDWIQVESGRLKGWINAGFLAPSEPR
jgi:Bacterial SH3 domain